MVLNSQSPRPGARHLYMTRKNRRLRLSGKWIIVVIAVVIVGYLGWHWVSGDAEQAPAPAAADSASAAHTTPSATTPPPHRVRTSELPPPHTAAQNATPGTHTNPSPRSTQAAVSASGPPATPLPPPPAGSSADDTRYTQAMNMIAEGQLVEGRAALSRLLLGDDLHLRPADAATARRTLTSVNEQLIFGEQINDNDPLTGQYVVQQGDALARIAAGCKIPYQLLQQINQIANANNIHPGQKLKIIHGPFHVRVVKHDYRLDVYLKDNADQPIYVRSFPIGLGAGDSTPVGNWIVRRGGKVQNPAWTNPRTNEHFTADNPKNPIGEYWIPLQGADPTTENLNGYGIHGTIDPDSIGGQFSMGCIRLRDKDIEQLYHMLTDGQSTVQILP